MSGRRRAACCPWRFVEVSGDVTRPGVDERRRIALFAAAECMFLYLESSLGVGSGEERREVALPIQREAATVYPLLPGSSLKGVLRARARSQQAPAELFGLLGSAPEGEERQP